jgi:HlyD family secretion protein
VLIFAIAFVILIVILVVYLGISRNKNTGELILSGVVEATENNLSFRIAGQIESIYFDEGDFVDSGGVVAELEKKELAKAADQAEKNYEAVKASITQLEVSLETTKRNLERIKPLIPLGAATQTQYDDLSDQKRQIKAQLSYARKNMEAARDAAELAQIRLGYAVLNSFSKGTVLSRMHEPGEVVVAGAPILTLAYLDDLKIRIYLPEIYLGKVRLDQEVNISIDSHPDTTFSARVKFISDKAEFTPKNVQTKAERVKQVFAIDIATTSHGGVFKPGLPCDVEIPIN